ncbi:MAG TPA: hypothetical protein VFB60_10275 [Ktedonobacteraceae bacterium]|nr:hypothetical protein [Ktedonobacteraceae bacterium]
MIETRYELLWSSASTGEAQRILLREINLGTHHLLLNSDQSIELMRAEPENPEPEYVLCLDAVEAYRLMMALQESFHVKTDE